MTKNKKNNASTSSSKAKNAEIQPFKTPEFGHQLNMRACAAPSGNEIDDWMRFAPTQGQRLRRFATAFLGGFVLALAALCILYLPDFAFDYAHRSDEFLAFFRNFLLIGVTFIGFAAAMNTLIRDTIFYVSAKAKCIVIARKLTLPNINAAIHLENIQMAYIPPEGIFKTAQINIQHQGQWITLAKSQGACEDIDALKTWLQALKDA